MTLDSLLRDAAQDVDAVVANLDIPVFGHRSPPARTWRRWQRGLAVALAAATVVTVAMLLPRLFGPAEPGVIPVVEEPPITTVTPAPTTTSPTTTTIAEPLAYVPYITWTMVESPAFDLSGVAADVLVTDEMVYAAGSDASGERVAAAVWRSQDGADWEQITDPSFAGDANFNITQLAQYSNTLVGVGSECSADWAECGPAVWVSDGGEVWERLGADAMAVFGGGFRGLSSVVATDDGFLVGGTGIWASVDGRTWTRVFEGSSAIEIRQILDGPSQILAVGVSFANIGDAVLLRSMDSINWDRVKVPHLDQAGFLFGVTDTAGGYLAVGGVGPLDAGPSGGMPRADAAAWLSADGVEWTRVEHDPKVLGGGRGEWMQRAVSVDELVVSVGTMISSSWSVGRVLVWESEDGGRTWVRVSDPAFGRDSGGYTSTNDLELFGSALIATGQQEGRATVWIGVVDN